MKPGANHIGWGLGSFLVCGATIILARRFHGSDPVYGLGAGTVFWMFLFAGAILGLTGAYLFLIGIFERRQYRRARASISTSPAHRPSSHVELVTRIAATLAMTDGDLTDDKIETLRRIFSQMEGNLAETEAVRDLIGKAVSNDIASEILAAEDSLDPGARDFILNSCYQLLDVMDDPGTVQADLLVRMAAAMGMSELGLTAHQDSFERSAAAGSD